MSKGFNENQKECIMSLIDSGNYNIHSSHCKLGSLSINQKDKVFYILEKFGPDWQKSKGSKNDESKNKGIPRQQFNMQNKEQLENALLKQAALEAFEDGNPFYTFKGCIIRNMEDQIIDNELYNFFLPANKRFKFKKQKQNKPTKQPEQPAQAQTAIKLYPGKQQMINPIMNTKQPTQAQAQVVNEGSTNLQRKPRKEKTLPLASSTTPANNNIIQQHLVQPFPSPRQQQQQQLTNVVQQASAQMYKTPPLYGQAKKNVRTQSYIPMVGKMYQYNKYNPLKTVVEQISPPKTTKTNSKELRSVRMKYQANKNASPSSNHSFSLHKKNSKADFQTSRLSNNGTNYKVHRKSYSILATQSAPLNLLQHFKYNKPNMILPTTGLGRSIPMPITKNNSLQQNLPNNRVMQQARRSFQAQYQPISLSAQYQVQPAAQSYRFKF